MNNRANKRMKTDNATLVLDLERAYRMTTKGSLAMLMGSAFADAMHSKVPWPNREACVRKAAAVLLPPFCLRACAEDTECLVKAMGRVMTSTGPLGFDTLKLIFADDVTRAVLFAVMADHAQARAAAGNDNKRAPLKRQLRHIGPLLAQARLRGQGSFGNLDVLPRELRDKIANSLKSPG